ncbi:MAG: acyl-CoA dehydrogenase family protein, partial [Gammaproteobacteria bacterium]
MKLVLNEEEALLKRVALKFFIEKMPVKKLRELRDTNDIVGYDPICWREMADLGWAGILISELYAGTPFGYRGIGQVLEASGRTLAATPLISTALIAAPLIMAAGTDEQKAALLPAIAAGARIVALAHEETARHAPRHIATRAEPHPGGYRLSGTKMFVLDGHVATELIVVARTAGGVDEPQGLTLFIINADTPGVQRQRAHLVDTRNAATVTLDKVFVSAGAILGELDHGRKFLDPVLDGARSGLAAEMLGSALEAFERTRAYLKLRTQFGVPIGSFQALKHRAALMYCELELTQSAV